MYFSEDHIYNPKSNLEKASIHLPDQVKVIDYNRYGYHKKINQLLRILGRKSYIKWPRSLEKEYV